ncbi:uncharacterized protein [Typha latifolia]|uniref:uncharacterized protein n=1 Tax=Typha latifolia TaxID=4733 RepID=UPI003C2AE3EC
MADPISTSSRLLLLLPIEEGEEEEDYQEGHLETVDPSPFLAVEESDDMDDHEVSSDFLGFNVGSEIEDYDVGVGDQDRIAGFEPDPTSDGQIDESFGLPLCWDCLQFEEQRRDPNEDFEWEEIDGRDHDGGEQEEEEEVDAIRNLEWEVLLDMNSLGRNPMDADDGEAYFVDDHDDFESYEVLSGEFADYEIALKGGPPAAKSAVESLPSVVLTKEDFARDEMHCAVCKDGILIEERVKRLPCSHHYHEECILPWLGIRNSCPLCRYELPTDDPEYEKWKAGRVDEFRDEFEILPQEV